MPEEKPFIIAQISDFHAGSQYFVSNLLSQTIKEVNDYHPDVVVVTGDLTEMGFRQEFRTAAAFLEQLNCSRLVVIPGNHDSRNVGYLHFEEIFGERNIFLNMERVCLAALDSTQPDLDDGRIGRERYRWLQQNFAGQNGFKIVALHHHLIPIPGTGRERNIIYDAGDFLEVLIHCGVNLVLSGHKHVPYLWKVEDMYILTAGTTSSLRLRGYTRPCYNLIQIFPTKVSIYRCFPFEGKELTAKFELKPLEYCLVPVAEREEKKSQE